MAEELVESKRRATGDAQEQLNAIRAALQQPIKHFDALLGLLLAPLDLLGLLPIINEASRHMWKRHTSLEPTQEARNAALRPAWLADVQTAIVTRIAVDWAKAPQDSGLWSSILSAFFFPKLEKTLNSSLVQPMGQSEEQDVAVVVGKVQLVTLRNLSSLLTQQAQHPSTKEALREVLYHFHTSINVQEMAAAAMTEAGVARATLTWEDAVRDLCSLRVRVANWAKGEVMKDWESNSHEALLGTQLEAFIFALSTNASAPKGAATTLITKLLRTGYLSAESKAWTALLSSMLVERAKPTWSTVYVATWHKTLAGLLRDDRAAFLRSVLAVLDDRLHVHSAHLYSASEARGTAEGEGFQSAEARQARRGAVALLELFVGATTASSSSVDASDSEDDEDSVAETIVELALGANARSHAAWKPAMAVVLASLAYRMKSVDQLARRVLESWGDVKRIPLDGFDRELYLTTLLLVLPLPPPHAAELLHGVSAHLDHMDPAARRMGMLVAELVSVKAASTGKPGEAPSKPLSFGSSMWEGTGEGKNEARALRRLHLEFSAQFSSDGSPGSEAAKRLGLLPSVEILAVSVPSRFPQPARKAPKTRKLPERRPAAAAAEQEPKIRLLDNDDALLQTAPRQRGGALIVELDSHASSSAAQRGSANGGELRPLQSRESDSEQSSSSESDSSESDEEDVLAGLEGLGMDREDIDTAQAQAQGGSALGMDEEQFGMGVPKKKRRRTPVYVGDLAPLLRENQRDANRIGLKSAEALLRRKRGWGGEIDENSVDLAHALCGLQNNFGLKQFEERRVAALAALVVASPRITAPAIIEQYFHHQYSITQRVAMLLALATAARELAGLSALSSPTQNAEQSVEDAADALAKAAIGRAKEEGEARVPAIAREKALSLGRQQSAVKASHTTLAGASVRPMERYVDLAPSVFVMPLVNRQWTAMKESGARGRKVAGAGTLPSPSLVARLLDTLAVLAHAARHASSFLAILVPEVLELVQGVSRMHIADAGSQAGVPQDDGRTIVAGAAASLALVVLDASWELDGGRTLLREKTSLLLDIADWAEFLFNVEDAKGKSVAAMGRAGRSSAAIVLRVHEIRQIGAQ